MLVLDQIDKLLHPSDPNTQREANNFLIKWQKSVEAWTESHSILNGNYSVEAKFIASQTLRTKILYDFYQLPSDYFLKICESLLSYLNQNDIPLNISSTVALSVCDMAIQMSDSWESPVESFISYYKSNRLSLEMVLFLLQSLPEEISSNRLILVPEHHTKITIKFKSEYAKVVEFLSLVRNNIAQLSSKVGADQKHNSASSSTALNYKMLGSVLKVWNNWRRFDTFSSSEQLCTSFLNDCLEIIRTPKLRNEGLEDETYEISVDCIVDCLEECAYLTNKQAYSPREAEFERPADVSSTRHKELLQLQKACFDVLVRQMQSQLAEAFASQDVFLLSNVSRLLVNLVDSVNIDHRTADPDVLLLLDQLVKFIALPYLLLYSNTSVSECVNPFRSDYSHLKSRETIIKYLNGLNSGAPGAANCSSSGAMDLDDEVCNISQKSVFVLADILSKLPKQLGGTLPSLSALSSDSKRSGLLPQLVGDVLELLLLVSVPSYRLYVYSNPPGSERNNYTEHIDNYCLYTNEVAELHDELLRLVGRNAVFEYVRSNLLSLSSFSSNALLIHSALTLLPQCLSITSAAATPSSSVVVAKTESVQAAEKLVLVVGDILNTSVSLSQNVYEGVLLLMVKVDCIKFLGSVRKIFTVPDTSQLLKEAFLMLTKQITAGGQNKSDLSLSSLEQDVLALHDRLRYESGFSISSICYHVKMEKLSNNEQLLTILLGCLENVDNELLVMIFEGLSVSCYNLRSNDLLTVFSQLIGSTLAQLAGLVSSVPANTAIAASRISGGDRALIVRLLNRIVGFVRNLKNKPALEPVVGERILPLLFGLLRIFYLDCELVESVCRCIKHNARVLDLQFAKHIPELVQTISTAAQVKMFGTYLYLIEWLHSIFYSPDSARNMSSHASAGPSSAYSTHKSEIVSLYQLLTSITLNIFKSSYNHYTPQPHANRSSDGSAHASSRSGNDAQTGLNDENELLIEDFYGLQAEFFLNSDMYLSDLNSINEIINCSCKFMFIKRPQCVFYFWESLLKMSRKNAQVSLLVTQYLQSAITNCFVLLTEMCTKSTEHNVENLVIGVLSHVRSSHFVPPNAVNVSQAALSAGGLDREKYIELLLAAGLACLPSEIVGNEKLKLSFLSGLLSKPTSAINHLHKLLSKLSMRNRM